MSVTVPAAASPPVPGRRSGGRSLPEWLALLRARLRSAARCLTLSRRLPRRNPRRLAEVKPAAVIGMIPAVLRGGPYCGDEISVPADARRLTRPDGSVYLRSSLTDSGGRPVFMLRLGRRTLDLPRQSDLP